MVIKTIGIYFGIVIEVLPYIIGLNVSQNKWRMAISGDGIIPGGINMGGNSFFTIHGHKQGC